MLLPIPQVKDNLHVGVIGLAGFVIVVAIDRMAFGYKRAKRQRTSFWNDPYTRRGRTNLSALVFVFLFVARGAGLRFWTR